MKTVKSYSDSVRDRYLRATASGELSKFTPAKIRKMCLNLSIDDLSHSDKITLNNYFKTKNVDDLKANIWAYAIVGFRPICKFLRKETQTMASHEAIELIALLINFRLRPYKIYKTITSDDAPLSTHDALIATGEQLSPLHYSASGTLAVLEKIKGRNVFARFRNAPKPQHLIIFSGSLLFFISVYVITHYILNDWLP